MCKKNPNFERAQRFERKRNVARIEDILEKYIFTRNGKLRHAVIIEITSLKDMISCKEACTTGLRSGISLGGRNSQAGSSKRENKEKRTSRKACKDETGWSARKQRYGGRATFYSDVLRIESTDLAVDDAALKCFHVIRAA